MSRAIPAVLALVLVVGGFIASELFDMDATTEGENAIAEMEAVQAAICSCEANDIECVIGGYSLFEQTLQRHSNTMVSDDQAERAEEVAARISDCMESSIGA